MNIYEIVESRRTIHKFEPHPISTDFLKTALQAALTAPNHRHTFPWHFVIVGQKARARLVDTVVQIDSEKDGVPVSEKSREKVADKYLSPSALVVFCRKNTEDEFQAKEDYASIACSIENFSLVLTAEGWGSKWSTGKITKHPRVYEVLGIDSAKFDIEGFVWVGKPDSEPGPQRRPKLDEVLKVLD